MRPITPVTNINLIDQSGSRREESKKNKQFVSSYEYNKKEKKNKEGGKK